MAHASWWLGMVVLGASVGCGDETADSAEGATAAAGSSSTAAGDGSSPATTGTPQESTGTSSVDSSDATTDGGDSGEPVAEVAYRITDIALRDPHFFFAGFLDVTDSQVNVRLAAEVGEDGDDDGLFDLSFVLRFDPLDQTGGATFGFTFVNADCSTGPDEIRCSPAMDAVMAYDTVYTSSTDAGCLAADPAALSQYNLSPAQPDPTQAPCFRTERLDAMIPMGSFVLPLRDTVMAAQFVGDPASALVTGNIEGHLSEIDAMALQVPFNGDEITLSDLLRSQDRDGDGWTIHVSFTAQAVPWFDR